MFCKAGVLPSKRLRAVLMLMDLNCLQWEQAERVESGVACFSNAETYENQARRVCHNLHFNPDLARTYELREIASLTNEQMQSPVLKHFQQQEIDRAEAISSMMKEKYDNVNATSVNSSALKCKHCGSSDIHFEQKQTRGADEAMTIFCSCSSCDARWKMS